MQTADIIVIGAGIAGISAAAELAADATVTVLEMEAQTGYHASGFRSLHQAISTVRSRFLVTGIAPEGDFSMVLNYIDDVAPDRLIGLEDPG